MSYLATGHRGRGSVYGIKSMPMIERAIMASRHLGRTIYVDSNVAVEGNGDSWQGAKSTLEEALDLAVADDTILVAPGHAESIASAAAINLDKAGLTILGLGNGARRPTLTFTTADTADLEVDAANITLAGFRFVTDVDSLAAAIDVDAAGFTLEDCDFYGNAGAAETNLITIITDANANHLTVRRCGFHFRNALDATAITTTSTEVIRLVGADFAIIEDCYFDGDFTTSVINGITTASKSIQILRNRIVNIATENIAGLIDLVANCTGVIAHNVGFIGYTTSLAAVIDPSSCAMIENYFSNVVTEAGGLVGTAST